MTENFHRNSDVDRLYVKRTDGGRGLKNFEACFKTRIVGLRRHLMRDSQKNNLLVNVLQHETDRIIRIDEEYENMYLKKDVEEEETNNKNKTVTRRLTKEINKQSKDRWQAKAQHGYVFKKTLKKENTNANSINLWLKR